MAWYCGTAPKFLHGLLFTIFRKPQFFRWPLISNIQQKTQIKLLTPKFISTISFIHFVPCEFLILLKLIILMPSAQFFRIKLGRWASIPWTVIRSTEPPISCRCCYGQLTGILIFLATILRAIIPSTFYTCYTCLPTSPCTAMFPTTAKFFFARVSFAN